VSGGLADVIEPVLSNAIQYWKNIDQEVGERIEAAVRARA
jgi:catalase